MHTRHSAPRQAFAPKQGTVRTAVVAAFFVAALGLTGCTSAASDEPPKPNTSESDQSASATESETPSETSDAGAGSSADLGLTDFVPRAEMEAAVQETLDCASGSETISGTGTIVAIGADCDNVTVSGTGTVVLAENISSLTVTGSGSVVYVKSLDSVTGSGSGNVAVWESGTPSVADTGQGNVFAKNS